MYSLCLRASFVKAYDYARLALAQNPEEVFFFTATLRGITEDFITLRFLSDFSPPDRQFVCRHLFLRKYSVRVKQQREFFKTFRPFQPVINSGMEPTDSGAKLRAYWQANGWPGLNRDMPPTRAMAERADPGILGVVYDFLFRLTSNTVHFDPPILFRSGWGRLPELTFGMHNLGRYYHALCTIYGSYLFCLYCEAFEEDIDPSVDEKIALAELRNHLLQQSRWPEMVTFEEMNVDVPQTPAVPQIILKAAYDIVQQEGFLAGARAIIDREQFSKDIEA